MAHRLASFSAALGLDLKSFSRQDLIAYIYSNGKTDGIFVDIGAHDGVAIGNTFALEKLGWRGVCIEPVPEIFALLEQNRSCLKYNVAISTSAESHASFLKVPSQEGLSGLARQMPPRIRHGLAKQGLAIEEIQVKSVTFNSLMGRHPEMAQIDFLSVDVEGGEMEVLRSINLNRFRFGLIAIENNAGTETFDSFMAERGYRLFMDLGVDLLFVPDEQ